LDEELRASVFGNVDSFASFRVEASDAKLFAEQYGDKFSPSQFTNLANFEMCAELVGADPFFGKTHMVTPRHTGRTRIVKKQSRKRFAVRAKVAEARLKRWRA
jgi:hypothetical protein